MGDAMGGPALDSATAEQLNNAETKRLLDTIDSLRDLSIAGIGIVDLPQIIVVGDQCSGKSSVLEAISRVHFPISDGICTRFPTELVLRRAPKESTDLRIRYAATDADAASTHTPFHESGFHRSELPVIINRAKEHMGLADGKTTGFSKHVLRVEICGPDIPSLTLVDLPGIFHSGSSSQPQEWKAVVDEMVENYMRQKNSIVLMVVSADISLSKHAILDMALQHDAARERTIGVITKVDLCPGSNLEDEYLRLARGQEPSHQPRLGWHVLRNRGPKEVEVDFDQRDVEEEKFLKTGVWSTLPLGSRGVDSLRKSLGAALLKQIKGSLPELIRDINDNLQNRQRRLAKLGTTRTNPDEMRDYLLSISTTFHRLAEHAVEGRYNDPFFATPTGLDASGKIKFRKLRSLLRNLDYAFDITMRTKGARYKMDWDQPKPRENPRQEDLTDEEILADALENYSGNLEPFLDLYDFPDPVVEGKGEAFDRIEHLASESQGAEFSGLPSNDFIMQLFREQSQPWRPIAECHMGNVMERARLFVYQIFDYILEDDERTRDAILAECVDPSFDSMTDALKDKLDEIMRPYTSGHGLPLEIDFRAGVWKRKLRRMKSDSVDLLDQNSVAYNTAEYRMLKPEDIINVLIQADSSAYSYFGIDVAVDMMLTHYQMSLRTFTDNVVHLVVENCLVSKLPDIFSARVVTQMSDETLERLAEESDEVKLERSQLADEVEKLKTGLQICQRSRPRDFQDLPETFVEMAPKTDAPKTDAPETDAPQTDIPKRKIRVKLPPVSLPERKLTSLRSDNGKTPARFEPAVASTSSTNSGQSTTAESSRQGQTTTASSGSAGQSFATPTAKAPTPDSTTSATPAPAALPFGLKMESEKTAPRSSIFGSTATSTTVPTEPSAFGSTKASTATTAPVFGSVSPLKSSLPAFGSISALQSSAAKLPVFGSTTTSAATTSTLSAFGSTAASTAAGSTPSVFGSSTATTTADASKPSIFGSTTPSATTAAPPSAFGSTTTTTANASKTSVFGSTTPSTTPSAFGSTTTSGAPPLIRSFFGSTTASAATAAKPSVFGSTTPSATAAATPSVFGSTTTSTAAVSAFGSPALRNPLSGRTFGSTDISNRFLGNAPSTAAVPFDPFHEEDYYYDMAGTRCQVYVAYQTLEAQLVYKMWSADELRQADYVQGRRPPARLGRPFGVSVASELQASEGTLGTTGGTTAPPPKRYTLFGDPLPPTSSKPDGDSESKTAGTTSGTTSPPPKRYTLFGDPDPLPPASPKPDGDSGDGTSGTTSGTTSPPLKRSTLFGDSDSPPPASPKPDGGSGSTERVVL